MNINSLIASVSPAISPLVTGNILVSNGSAIVNFQMVPIWTTLIGVLMRFQALSGSDLKQLDGINTQSIMRAVYINGNIEGVDRFNAKGGDQIIVNGVTWKITQVLETWDAGGWCKVAVTQQSINAPL